MGHSRRSTPYTLERAFGEVIRELRMRRGLKQVEVSTATGYSQRTIGMVERGEKSPTLRTMEDLATFYGVGLEKLLVNAKRLRKGERLFPD